MAMEMKEGRSAKDLIKTVKKVRLKQDQDLYTSLRETCSKAVSDMVRDGNLQTEVELDDLTGLTKVVDELVGLGYRYCLIETENEKGDILNHRLRISLSHLV